MLSMGWSNPLLKLSKVVVIPISWDNEFHVNFCLLVYCHWMILSVFLGKSLCAIHELINHYCASS